MKKSFILACSLSSLSLAACTTVMENLPGVYTLDIQQGNIIDQETIDQLRPGMNKRQVLYIMGSPMLIDAFQKQRWDYVYSEQKEDGPRLQKKITLLFDEDNLVGVQGDFRPSSKPVERVSHETTLELPKRNLEKTVWEKITGLFSSDEPAGSAIEFKKPDNAGFDNDPLSSSSRPN